MRLGVAPISWGVSGVSGWGFQLPAERVLAEARQLQVAGLEAGPQGFLTGHRPGWPRLAVAAGVLNAVFDRSALPAVDRHARDLRRLGARVLVVSARYPDGQAGVQSWARFFDAVAGLESICRNHGLELAFHPHLGSEVGDPAQLERFLVGCEAGLCLDTGDMLLGDIDPVEIVELAPRRIRHVHLKEVDQELAEELKRGRLDHSEAVSRGLYLPLDRGTGRAMAALVALRRSDFLGWLVIEQARRLDGVPPPGTGPLHDIQRSLELIRRTV
jgi:inosose dehydratase